MTRQNSSCKLIEKAIRFMFAMVLGAFVLAFSSGAFTAQAAETSVENAVVNEDQASAADSGDDNTNAVLMLLMGGMLVIILAVVISVVSTFVSSAAIADEL